MDKRKRDIVILVILTAFLVNYVIYFYIIVPKFNDLKNLKNQYNELQQKIEKAKELKAREDKINQEINELIKETEGINILTPNKIDTPQLIYDFYNYCKKYNVVGENIEFQLDENNIETNDDIKKIVEGINKEINANSKEEQSNLEQQNQTANENKDSSKFKKLDITLNVYCANDDLDKFLKNLDYITKRKLNVKLISISQVIENEANQQQETEQIDIQNEQEIDEHTKKIQGKLPVKIVFTQYLYIDSSVYENNYEYFDIKIGFEKIGDIFKNN